MGTLTGAAQTVAANKQRGRSVAAGIRKMREKADMQLKFLKAPWYRPTPIRRLRSVFGHPWHGFQEMPPGFGVKAHQSRSKPARSSRFPEEAEGSGTPQPGRRSFCHVRGCWPIEA